MLHKKHSLNGVVSANYHAPALRLGISLVRVLSVANEPMRLSDLARAIGSNKNTTTRLLATLQREGWVGMEMPGPQYHLTLTPFCITSRMVNRLDIRQAARVPLRELWEETGESVYLGVLRNHQVLYLEHLDATGPVKIAGQVGGQYPLHCSAPGKVLLAFAGETTLRAIMAQGLKRYTELTLTSEKRLQAEIARVRDKDFAVDNEEYGRGLICYAAPVRDAAGQVVGTIGASATTIFYDLAAFTRQVGKKVSRAAAEVSKRLGYEKINSTTNGP